MILNHKTIIKLKKENEQLKEMLIKEHENFEKLYKLLEFYKDRCKLLEAAVTGGDIDFPNTEERGTGEQEQPINVSDIFES
jgi:hypothetical protein